MTEAVECSTGSSDLRRTIVNRSSSRVVPLLLAVALLLGTRLSGAAADPAYEIVDLGATSVPGSEAIIGGAQGINEKGHVVGFVSVSPERTSPFIFRGSKVKRVKSGKLGATFQDINDQGVIVGREVTARAENGAASGFPAVWVKEKQTLLELPVDEFGQAGIGGVARAINDDGVIAGEVNFPDHLAAVVWEDGSPRILPAAFGDLNCVATDVNNDGVIGGICRNPATGGNSPVLWHGDEIVLLDPLGYQNVELLGLGEGAPDELVATGTGSSSAEEILPIRWTGGSAQVLDNLSGRSMCGPFDVAEAQTLVGTCYSSPFAVEQASATIWEDGEAIDANTRLPEDSGWMLSVAYAMNDRGWIVGIGLLDGERHAFLLRPVEE
jgi:uncharacterized membrane protein